ncbi:MAG: glycosyltransferase family 4 protein [Desulfobacterales bacterium]|nr:glycosyltransferase family 4 protein [Desulfobacterales bacterium]
MLPKVIYFASSYRIGLTALLTEKACTLIKKSGVEFLFISGEKEQLPGLFDKLKRNHINFLKIRGIDDHRDFRGLVRALSEHVKQFNPDMIHVQTNWQLAIVLTVKHLVKKKFLILYTIHGYRHNFKIRSLIAKYLISFNLVLFADKVFAPSTFLKKQFRILNRKIEILFLGVDKSFFTDYVPTSFTTTKRIVFPGEFRDGKNQDVLIRVIRKYIDETGDEDVELCLPGKGKNLKTCKALSKKLGLEEKVFFPGVLNRKDILKCYLQSQFVVIPTNIETFGLCIAEAFVLGRVVTSRRVGVAEDIITHRETGFLFNTEKELLDILLEILTDTDTCLYVSQNAYKARNIFLWDNICNKYIEIINAINP